MKANDRHARWASAFAVALACAGAPWFVVGTACAQQSSGAAEAPAGATAKASDIGRATAAWLALQRSNAAAAPAQPTLGAEATLAYQRYLESFKSKIPERFDSSMGQGQGQGQGQGGNGVGVLVGYGGTSPSN